jgi:hypothetical protein
MQTKPLFPKKREVAALSSDFGDTDCELGNQKLVQDATAGRPWARRRCYRIK